MTEFKFNNSLNILLLFMAYVFIDKHSNELFLFLYNISREFISSKNFIIIATPLSYTFIQKWIKK